MAAMERLLLVAILLISVANAAVTCACDPEKPETMEMRQCSLCREAEKHSADERIFFLKDINPRKPPLAGSTAPRPRPSKSSSA